MMALGLLLAGCAATPKPLPSPTVTSVDPGSLIGQLINPVGTTWTGTDSAGDLSSFVLRADHTVAVTYGTNSFAEPSDTWAVVAGVLDLHVFISPGNGELDYTGTYNPGTKTLAATAVTSRSAKTVIVDLTQK